MSWDVLKAFIIIFATLVFKKLDSFQVGFVFMCKDLTGK
jgi:hypothetical protein